MADPHALLGIPPGASPEEARAAYRRLAKRHHPDRQGEAETSRMAELNAAYAELLASLGGTKGGSPGTPRAQRRRPRGWWLTREERARLAPELLVELLDREPLQALAGGHDFQVAVTDRRLLRLRDDLVMGRVLAIPLYRVRSAERRAGGRLRRPHIRVETIDGRVERFPDPDDPGMSDVLEALQAPRPGRAAGGAG